MNRRYEPIALGVILLITLFVYLPALQGDRLWDDDAHITKPELQSLQGLFRIWFEPGATQQYYPLLHSAFWIEHKLWGDSMLGYHLVNVLWHMLAVSLVYLNLKTLNVPGAILAAAIFAVHPVMVESVVWISEQKNTLSAVFYLSAMFVYLRFDRSRKRADYALAFGLFVLGLLTKTVTATLPAALLVIFWWQRGTLSWNRDVRPLLPMFALGAVAGLFTAWVERRLIGAEGADFELTLLQRSLLAGRVVWFYLAKLVWPTDLIFIYPRWQIDPATWWQWLFPIATLGVLLLLWAVRRAARGPLAASLLFVGTLLPVLGFLNVYPFIYSFVADHFQYLASLAVIALAASAVAIGLQRLPQTARYALGTICILLVGALAALSWRQCGMYADPVTLYQSTIDRNPDCWMAYNNLGLVWFRNGNAPAAIDYYRTSLRLKPDSPAAHTNLGTALANSGQIDEAIAHFHEALRVEPDLFDAHHNLGSALLYAGRYREAADELRAALELQHEDPGALNSLGAALMKMGRYDEAMQHLEHALRLRPNFTEAHNNLGLVLGDTGKSSEAIEQFRLALELDDKFASAYKNWGLVLADQGNLDGAIEQFEQAIRLAPNQPDFHNHLGDTFRQNGQPLRAIEHYQQAVQLKPNYLQAYVNLAQTLALVDRSHEAVATAEKAIETARRGGQESSAEQIEEWLRHYQKELERGR